MQLTCTLIDWDRQDVMLGTAGEPVAGAEYTATVRIDELAHTALLVFHVRPSRDAFLAALRHALRDADAPPAIEHTFTIDV
ncbi:MAG: hypothetical protein WD359_07720 [Dehalococcoidia bacterium]